MSPRFVFGRENVPCVAEVVNRSLKADCTDFTTLFTLRLFCGKSFIWFCLDILTQILWGILFGSASRVNWDKLTVSEMVQDIESVGQRDWFICHILWVYGLEIITLKIFVTCLFSWFENSKGACIKAFRDDFVLLQYFLIDSCQQGLSTRILLWFNQLQTSFQTYLHRSFTVCCFVQKDHFNLNYRNAWRNHLRGLKGKLCIIGIGENTLSIEYSDIYHVLSNLFPWTRFLFPAKFLYVKIRKTKSCPKFFHRIYGYKIVITDNHFNNQKGVD